MAWPLLFGTACSTLWHTCNQCIFEGIIANPQAVIHKVSWLAKDYNMAIASYVSAQRKVSDFEVRQIRLYPPPDC